MDVGDDAADQRHRPAGLRHGHAGGRAADRPHQRRIAARPPLRSAHPLHRKRLDRRAAPDDGGHLTATGPRPEGGGASRRTRRSQPPAGWG
ncbi:hypothetical protein KL86PLE_41472 [uncultured Pleomorphomonas sp.]|uniref:Uncharacterized protein n=1 Tax=uncultured Pleomorphomonas sp. TaxID=442121 RepID=A0A212LJK1_9HYPH|nr:hypothetical protein KL86PLE_41472 [uncultured Pleomorphomonas sp.]